MKYFLIIILISLITLNCNKSNISPASLAFQPRGFKIKYPASYEPDSAAYFTFLKDNLGRVTYFFGYYGDSGMINPHDTILAISFEYDGINNLPSSAYSAVGNAGQQTHYYFYDNDNLLIRDSTVLPSSAIVIANQNHYLIFNYHYNNSYMIQSIQSGFPNNYYTAIDSFLIVNGNILAHKYDDSFLNGITYHYEYDNGINTLNNINIAPIFFTFNNSRGLENSFWSSWNLSCRNNEIRITGSENYSEYFYNANNIPTKRIFHYESPQNFTDTLFYWY